MQIILAQFHSMLSLMVGSSLLIVRPPNHGAALFAGHSPLEDLLIQTSTMRDFQGTEKCWMLSKTVWLLMTSLQEWISLHVSTCGFLFTRRSVSRLLLLLPTDHGDFPLPWRDWFSMMIPVISQW